MFKENSKAIYLQIVDRICDSILTGEYPPGERIISVREMGTMLQVNPNTAMRAYDWLSQKGIIVKSRGIGYFVADDARSKVEQIKINECINNELLDIFHQLRILKATPEDLARMYQEYLDNNNQK